MENISNVSLVPLTESKYLTPMRMMYCQDGKEKVWDLMKCHSSVAVVIFNTDTNKFIFVQQFRPAVFVEQAKKTLGKRVMLNHHSHRFTIVIFR